MYTILGATGHTGSVIADQLIAKGERVRVVGRDAKRLERFTQKGAEVFTGDVTDADVLAGALAGSKAAYLLIPPSPSAPDVPSYQDRVSAAIAAAVKKSGLSHAVVLSSVGADKPDKTGPVIGLHKLEIQLSEIGALNALFLRAGYFMENILAQAGVIQSLGMLAGPLRPDLPLPLIATRDIGAAAADALLSLDFQGKTTCELLGPRDATYLDIAKVVGSAVGKSGLAYKQMPGLLLKPALMSMGMSASMVDLLLEMSEALNSGYMKALEVRSARNATPTTIETFVSDVFVPAYRAKAASA